MAPVYIASVFDTRDAIDQFYLWTTFFGADFLSVGCGRRAAFNCLLSMWLGGLLSRRVSRPGAWGAVHLDHRGKGSRPSGEGAWTVGSNASAAPLCRRGWCSGGVCEFDSRSARLTADVAGRLVISPGLEARRTRLAPRPSKEGPGHRGEGTRVSGRAGCPTTGDRPVVEVRGACAEPRDPLRRGWFRIP